MSRRPPLPVQDRPKQETPEEVIGDIMQSIRSAFYQGDKRWFVDQHFIRQRVVTYPAAWLTSRGVTLKPERYKSVLQEIIRTIKRNGDTSHVTYWPRYLLHCVQEHLKHHGEDLYNEGKSLRNALDSALARCRQAQTAPSIDCVEAIAQVHHALVAANKSRPKKSVKSKDQLSLF